jgi:poly(A) polymerase
MHNLARFMETQKTLREVLSALEVHGHQAHLVGGSVRDALLGRAAKDLDIATSAHPKDVSEIFRDRGFSVHETGIDHGTLTVVVDGIPFEITTWRRDVTTDGRRATIAFAYTLEEDARRRDFTINALYADRSGTVLDPTGQGMADILSRRVRFIDNAETRIREDTLRILRFFRFNAVLGTDIDRESVDFEECARASASVQSLPGERIGAEIVKLLEQRAPAAAMEAMVAASVTKHILQDFPSEAAFVGTKLRDLQIREAEAGLAPNPMRPLVLLMNDAPERALRLSKAQCQSFTVMSKALMSGVSLPELAYREGAEVARSVAALRATKNGGQVSTDQLDAIDHATLQKPPVSAANLMPDYQGAALGKALKRAEQIWIDEGFVTSRKDLLDRVRQSIPA